ncbi:transposase IS1182 family protein [Desulfitobacterium hafniense DCB-2]|uniref:Transposase I1182 family protein n=1 Tax=Desulfitobacterium hafniense (strain DSM 10664 / DCB-2) TaxID=272564 RepID=B8FSN6_DESHD|nr:IS1182-like element ISDha11 family transposase [Desulfitobacterium hafniense]ACL18256.1 transposase IS1182 family protein [Desulfitobacterium hafniense DCB-2]ACL19026.1 transposase IS1182 family protein [Desulfitobacterium hafniense DCB-2]ACL19038.1 transposase IS1182 family protein [Desulfitobacterium hafniense DCB-2]ACL20247.1 transposase I1182 family protein [Desulfitobacterium hafniense DCB-2]ACL22660.1 transposase IS1182 family protein [Desulfitobacterium hafniense DCB-2]
MFNIRQERLFSLEEILETSPRDSYSLILGSLDIIPLLNAVSKKAIFGAPTQLNYSAMIYSLIIRVIERIPTIKDLRKRLKNSLEFRFDCGFTLADSVPSEASYCRMIKKIQDSSALANSQDDLVLQAFKEGFIGPKCAVAIDATHIEARDRKPEKKKEKTVVEQAPKKRGRKPKAEREAWLKEQEELEKNRPIFEKKIEDQLPYSFTELVQHIPLDPQWGIKKNSEGKNVFWYGFKGHLLVDCKGQYVLSSLLSSGNINDGKMAIPLIKALSEKHPYLNPSHILADAGYDYAPIYEQARSIGAQALIDYNRRNEQLPEGKDKYFRPICQKGYSYRYDSYDPCYDTVKYTQPKECKECSLRESNTCQRVFKMKVSSDPRKYTVPARGSDRYFELYKQRTAVERVNAYLKEYFQLNNIRHRGKRAQVDFQFSILAYTLCKLAVDRLNKSTSMAA